MPVPASGAVVEVAAGVVFHGGRVLLSRRRAADHLGGLWEFPGGKLEPGEGAAECLRRELREELAIEVTVEEELLSLEHAYPERRVRLHFLRCRWTGGVPRALGCQAFAWVRPEELDRYPFPPADARLLALLQEHPEWWGPTPSEPG